MSKVMVIRKAFLQMQPDYTCWRIFWNEINNRKIVMKQGLSEIVHRLASAEHHDDANAFFFKIGNNSEFAFKDCERGIKEIPPMLDSSLKPAQARE